MLDHKYKKYDGKSVHSGESRSAPYPVSRLGAGVDLVDLAHEISKADSHVNTRVSAKLQVIVDQIRHLQVEARTVLEDAQRDSDLHRAKCNFRRIPGNVYHLYSREDGEIFFSMLSPREWGSYSGNKFKGSYQLENDMSWRPADEIDQPDDSREIIKRLLQEHF